MAATRLIALHVCKGKTVAQCLADRTDYSQNEEKTNGGEYISSYECDPQTADEEFMLSKRQYEHITGRQQERNVIAYQIRQSFQPGEVTPEEANRIGYELAMRWTKGKHGFVVATHVDKAHIHNHIIYNSTTLDGTKKYKNFFLSGLALQKASDILCLENGLSVIRPKPYRQRVKRTVYPKRQSFREEMRLDIDAILKQKPKDFTEFQQLLKERGYEYKDGRQPSIRGKGQKRFIRFSSLGAGYSVDDLRKIFSGESFKKENTETFQMLINIQKKIAEGKNGGYIQWVKRFNVKQASKAVVFLQEQGIQNLEELETRTKEITDRSQSLAQSVKNAERRLTEIKALKTHISNYSKTKSVYDAYRKSGYSRVFYEENKEALLLYKAAKTAFSEFGKGTLPRYKELTEEYAKVLEQKKEWYREYREVRSEMKKFQLAQEITRTFLNEEQQMPKRGLIER